MRLQCFVIHGCAQCAALWKRPAGTAPGRRWKHGGRSSAAATAGSVRLTRRVGPPDSLLLVSTGPTACQGRPRPGRRAGRSGPGRSGPDLAVRQTVGPGLSPSRTFAAPTRRCHRSGDAGRRAGGPFAGEGGGWRRLDRTEPRGPVRTGLGSLRHSRAPPLSPLSPASPPTRPPSFSAGRVCRRGWRWSGTAPDGYARFLCTHAPLRISGSQGRISAGPDRRRFLFPGCRPPGPRKGWAGPAGPAGPLDGPVMDPARPRHPRGLEAGPTRIGRAGGAARPPGEPGSSPPPPGRVCSLSRARPAQALEGRSRPVQAEPEARLPGPFWGKAAARARDCRACCLVVKHLRHIRP